MLSLSLCYCLSSKARKLLQPPFDFPVCAPVFSSYLLTRIDNSSITVIWSPLSLDQTLFQLPILMTHLPPISHLRELSPDQHVPQAAQQPWHIIYQKRHGKQQLRDAQWAGKQCKDRWPQTDWWAWGSTENVSYGPQTAAKEKGRKAVFFAWAAENAKTVTGTRKPLLHENRCFREHLNDSH